MDLACIFTAKKQLIQLVQLKVLIARVKVLQQRATHAVTT